MTIFLNTFSESLPLLFILNVMILLMILFIFLRTIRQKNYNFDNNRAIINEMRDSFEKSIYNLTERLLSTQDRWMDVNHLLISSQQNKTNDKENT